jgi:hypothetical protein
MRTTALATTLTLVLPVTAANLPKAPAAIERQLAAYNAHDLDAFMACYTDDVELYEFPDKPIAKGTAAMRERYKARFADTLLKAEVQSRIVVGERVIDREHIVRTWPEGPGTWEVVAIYELKNDRIGKVYFIFGAKTLDRSQPASTRP